MIKIGIIGAGDNGLGHAEYYAASDRVELMGIADPDTSRAGPASERYGCRAFTSHVPLLDVVDTVVISSPNHLHADHAIESARAGRHVFCEKPMGLNLKESLGIHDAVRDARVASTVGFSTAFGPVCRTMTRLARSGELGPIRSLWARRLWKLPPEGPAWRDDPSRSGGVLYEINVHELDWLMRVGGEVESVSAHIWAADDSHPRANDHHWVTLGFAGGATGTHEGSWCSNICNFYRGVDGTDAGVATDEWGSSVTLTRDNQSETIELDERFDLRDHFLDCIEQRAEPVADVAYALQVMCVAEAVLVSHHEQRLVEPAGLLRKFRGGVPDPVIKASRVPRRVVTSGRAK